MVEETSLPELTDDEIVKIFSGADPAYIPAEFIHIAKLVTPQGQVFYMDGHEYRDFVDQHPVGSFVGSVEIALNLDRFGTDVRDQTKKILGKGDANGYFDFRGEE